MSISLLSIISLSWLIAIRKYGVFSFVVAGVFGFTVYSIPAIIGLVFPFNYMDSSLGLTEASDAAVHVMIVAWLFFAFVIAVPMPRKRYSNPSGAVFSPDSSSQEIDLFVIVAVIFCILGSLTIILNEGLFFFLAPPEDQNETYMRLLWRWVNAIGFIAAIIAKNWRVSLVFLVGLVAYFITGDRTIFIITIVCVIFNSNSRFSWRNIFRFRVLCGCVALLAVSIFGKPIYLFIKSGSIEYLQNIFRLEEFQRLIITFEPFVTFNILDVTVSYDFRMSIWVFLQGVFAQLLIVPSLFGVDSNSFNTEFTGIFVPGLSYGIAGNYWAQAWALGQWVGVGCFAVFYGVALRVTNHCSKIYSSPVRVLSCLIGALIATYAHRNSLDNLLSFVRQIVLVWLLIYIISWLSRIGMKNFRI